MRYSLSRPLKLVHSSHVAFTKNIISPTLENQMMIKELTPFSASNASLCGADKLQGFN
jgi:hypothetical protein